MPHISQIVLLISGYGFIKFFIGSVVTSMSRLDTALKDIQKAVKT